MIIKGKSRGNGKHLARYLLHSSENEKIEVLERDIYAAGNFEAIADLDFHPSGRSKKTLYHAQINPQEHEAANMNKQGWLLSVDLLAKELGFENQDRVVVMHEKDGRKHVHVVWERFDLEKGRLISDSHNYRAHERAARAIEQQLGHAQQLSSKEHKQFVQDQWKKHKNNPEEFAREMEKANLPLAHQKPDKEKGIKRERFVFADAFGNLKQLSKYIGRKEDGKSYTIKDLKEVFKGIVLETPQKALEKAKAKIRRVTTEKENKRSVTRHNAKKGIKEINTTQDKAADQIKAQSVKSQAKKSDKNLNTSQEVAERTHKAFKFKQEAKEATTDKQREKAKKTVQDFQDDKPAKTKKLSTAERLLERRKARETKKEANRGKSTAERILDRRKEREQSKSQGHKLQQSLKQSQEQILKPKKDKPPEPE